MIRRRLVQ